VKCFWLAGCVSREVVGSLLTTWDAKPRKAILYHSKRVTNYDRELFVANTNY